MGRKPVERARAPPLQEGTMTTAALAALPLAVVSRDLLYMMAGAAALGALFVWTTSHLFADKPLRRRKKPLHHAS